MQLSNDEVVKVLEEKLQATIKIKPYSGEEEIYNYHIEALSQAISLIKELEELKKRIDVEKIAYMLFTNKFPQEPWADWVRKPMEAKERWFNRAHAIVNYLGS